MVKHVMKKMVVEDSIVLWLLTRLRQFYKYLILTYPQDIVHKAFSIFTYLFTFVKHFLQVRNMVTHTKYFRMKETFFGQRKGLVLALHLRTDVNCIYFNSYTHQYK